MPLKEYGLIRTNLISNRYGVPMVRERVILHIDMNAYFASVEQKSNPNLRGKPIVVCGDPTSRTAVAAASYEAKSLGVKAGMPLPEAERLCPGVVFIQGSPEKYYSTTVRIVDILKEYTPLVELFSVDEAFLDLTGTNHLLGSPYQIAVSLKERIRNQIGLTSSIGIAPNKLLAKLASDMEKPDGLVEIQPECVTSLLENLAITDLCGIGEKMQVHLNRMGIRTCGQLGRFPVDLLVKRFGVIGRSLHNMGRGIDESPVMPYDHEEPVKSMGHSHTLRKDTYDISEVGRYLLKLSEMVGRRLRQEGYAGRTVFLVIRYADYSTHSKQKTLEYFIDNGKEIFKTASFLLKHFDVSKGVRLIGVSLSNLSRHGQTSFLPQEERATFLTRAMDQINDRFGEFTVTWATVLNKDDKQRVIAPGTSIQTLCGQ